MMIDKIIDGRTDLVFDYLAQGGQATFRDSGGTSLIEWCAYYGDVSAIRYLLQQGESLDSLGNNLGFNGAVFHGHWQFCQFLIEQGADVNFADKQTGETPLHAATSIANRPVYDLIIQLLLFHGADPNIKSIAGVETGNFMRDSRTKGETPLHRAAAFASEESIKRLIKAGGDIESKDKAGDTPLSWASWHLRPDRILRLLCFGDFNIHPERDSAYDHGRGWRAMDKFLLGRPHL